MSWNISQMRSVALASAAQDYALFEAIGLSEMPGARVLDVGCSDGFNTRLKFEPYSNIAQVVGIDPSQQAIQAACDGAKDPRFSWEQADCETFCGVEGFFDVVYFGHSLQHMKDKVAALRNVRRLLKPGGFVLVKTVDDSCKISCPDPRGVMRRLLGLYEEHVLPNTAHTQFTERNMGSKCHALLVRTGFEAIQVRVALADTAGKTARERQALFERNVYFRRSVPDCVPAMVAAEIRDLLAEWEALFTRDDYYFASPTFMVVAQKPRPGCAPHPYFGPLFGGQVSPPATAQTRGAGAFGPLASHAVSGWTRGDEAAVCPDGVRSPTVAGLGESGRGAQLASRLGGAREGDGRGPSGSMPVTDDSRAVSWCLEPMVESDLGEVMRIELDSFPDPWTPVAYAMELRHNPHGTYVVARGAAGEIGGYVGWWEANGAATIANIAVDPALRRCGVGRLLLDCACARAAAHGCAAMQLQVRSRNAAARVFYASQGFSEVGVSKCYYADPQDDALILARPLHGG